MRHTHTKWLIYLLFFLSLFYFVCVCAYIRFVSICIAALRSSDLFQFILFVMKPYVTYPIYCFRYNVIKLFLCTVRRLNQREMCVCLRDEYTGPIYVGSAQNAENRSKPMEALTNINTNLLFIGWHARNKDTQQHCSRCIQLEYF